MCRFSSLALILSAILLVIVFSGEIAAQDQCNLAKDLIVQGLERVKTGTNDEVGDGLQLLKHATEVCISSGDAWYYRSLFENKLGEAAKAKYSLDKAKMFGSEAMDGGADPFHLATGGTVAKAPAGSVHEKWALVIGISKFQDKHLKGLSYSSKDAQDFANLLTDPMVGRFKSSNVHTLTGEVTTRQVKEDLNWLARSAGEDDLVVIFLSSHGTPRSFDTAEVNYIATSDTQVEPEDDLFATAMPMVEISDIVRTRVKARRTVIFLDTCHSGAATTSLPERATVGAVDSSASMDVLDRIRQGVGRVILTSSKPDEVSSEGAPFQNGYFTHFLLEALRQNQGLASIDQVYAYMSDQLPKAAQAVRKRQTPVISRSDLGSDIVLGSPTAVATGADASPRNTPSYLFGFFDGGVVNAKLDPRARVRGAQRVAVGG
jgi:uncharacterized caspase-like protein